MIWFCYVFLVGKILTKKEALKHFKIRQFVVSVFDPMILLQVFEIN